MSARLELTPAQTRAARWATVALLAWFGGRAVHLALVTPATLPPDEVEHFGRSAVFATTLGLPPDGPATYAFGLMSQRPYLYHWLMGRLLALSPFGAGADGLLLLRLANVGLVLLTLELARRAAAHLVRSALERGLFLVMASHTLMFTFLAGSVSYDNLANLLAAGAFAALFAHARTREPAPLAWLGVCVLAGCLTKTAFVPLAALLLLAVAWLDRRRPRETLARLGGWLAAPRPARWLPAALALLLLAANLSLYGGNLLRFGRPVPRCEQVLALDACLERPNFARNWILDVYRAGELDLQQALARTAGVAHADVRRDARFLVRNYERWSGQGRPLIGRLHYAFVWAQKMLRGATGILGHRSFSQPEWRLALYELLFLAAALAMVRRWRPGEEAGLPAISAFVVVAYATILMQLVNYPVYAASGSLNLALQGRYLFPVLVPLYALTVRYALTPFPPRARLAVAAAVALLFVSGDLPLYLQQRTPDWVGGP